MHTNTHAHTIMNMPHFFLVCDVKLSVTGVFVSGVERFGEKNGRRSHVLLLHRTSPPSCTCMVVETKGCRACPAAQDRPSLSKRPGMRCAGSRKKSCAFTNIYASCICTYAHTHTLIMHISQTHMTSWLAAHISERTVTHTHTMRKILMNYSGLPPMQFCVGDQAHHHAILHYFLRILSSLIFLHFCLMCCPVTVNSPHTT